MKKELKCYRWIYLLIPVQLISATLALLHYGFVSKSGLVAFAILILLLMFLYRQLRSREMIPLILAFSFSIVGDWFLSHRDGETIRFIYGIVFLLCPYRVSMVCPVQREHEMEIYNHPAYGL